MNFMVFILAFLMACDENTLTRTLHRPLAACTLFGAALGNVQAGLAAGAVLEIEALGFDAAGIPSNYILSSLAAALLAVNGTGAAESALAAAALMPAGYLLKQISGLINTALVPMARKAASERKEGGMLGAVLLSLVINGIVYGAAAMVLASNGKEIAAAYSSLISANGWILYGLYAGGVLTAAAGIAVLMRNLNVKEMPGVFFAGAAAAAVMCACGLSQAAMLLCALAAFGLSCMDYSLRKGGSEKAAEPKPVKKGGAQWW
ncbi:MAG: PTS sugar transporter subunit IIC [Solobacterium sp.]|nr:PTS sugar transporter subunit IIC [Solobacterium sp.]